MKNNNYYTSNFPKTLEVLFCTALIILIVLLVRCNSQFDERYRAEHGSRWPTRKFEVGQKVRSKASAQTGIIRYVNCPKYGPACTYRVDLGFNVEASVKEEDIESIEETK